MVDGHGGQGKAVKFRVERTGEDRVKLKAVAANKYLAIKVYKIFDYK